MSEILASFEHRGCFSNSLGKKRSGGRQIISIGDGCTRVGTIIHEMMHAIGFFHEHTRLDRDQYVTVEWKNIKESKLLTMPPFHTT